MLNTNKINEEDVKYSIDNYQDLPVRQSIAFNPDFLRRKKLLIAVIIPITIGVTFYILSAPSVSAQRFATGGFHSLALCNDTVWDWGWNDKGQLGDNTTTNRWTPVQVSALTGITAVAGGNRHSLALKNDGTVWNWGYNSYGQLGDNTITDRWAPVQVSGLTGATALAAGEGHSLALKNDGTVWGWGWNTRGQLGDNTATDKWTPVQVAGLSGVTAVAAGTEYHSMALKNDGTVWTWGGGTVAGFTNYGQLGNNNNVQQNTPVQVLGGASGSLYLTGIIAVAGGWYHSLALKNDGTVWAWGRNFFGGLGDNTITNRWTPVQVSGLGGITAIAGGYGHSLALKNDGTVWAWGLNDKGELGDNTTINRWTPVQVIGVSGITTLAGGGYHSLALKNDGTLWAWGYNANGQLGDNTNTNKKTPVQVSPLCNVSSVVTVSTTGVNVCSGNCATITANPIGGNLPYIYLWNPSGQTTQVVTVCPSSTTTYTVSVTDASGSTGAAISTVTISPTPIASVAGNTTVCAGANATLTASGGGTYLWMPGGQTTSVINPSAAGDYSVIVSNGSCSDTASATVTITSGTTTNQSASICTGSTYTLPGGTVVSTGGIYNDTLASAGGCDSIITTTLIVDSVFTVSQFHSVCSGSTYTLPGGTVVSTGGAYIDTLTSVSGCDSIITTNLTVNPNPTATAFSSVTITQGQSATLTAFGGGTYLWYPSTGLSCTTCSNPTATASPLWGAGGLVYCVTVTDSNNCTDTACVTVSIEQIDCSNTGEIYLPNAFSPNDDGENDVLNMYYGNLNCIKTFKFVIYNRWGEKVFESTNPADQWDSTYSSRRQAKDSKEPPRVFDTSVFVYYMNVTLISGEEISKKGNISLVR